MNIFELKNECEKIINDGGGKSVIVFDTEGGTFDCHIVKIEKIIYDKKLNDAINDNLTIFYCNSRHISHCNDVNEKDRRPCSVCGKGGTGKYRYRF